MASSKEINDLKDMANVIRRDSLLMTSTAGSGHPTSCLSCAEIMSCLFFHEMKYDVKNPRNRGNDEFILSKGHAAPVLYSCLKYAGCINEDLLSYRKLNSPLEGHPIPSSALPWVKSATGSLGQGLSIGLGIAMAQKMQKSRARTYVLLGDSEVAEGSVYESCELASFYKINNLCAILDANRLGQRGETMIGHNISEYKKRFISFGWNVITAEGHSISSLLNALDKARNSQTPSIIIAKTIKGKGVSFLENKNGWHGKVLDFDELEKALKEIPNKESPKIIVKSPSKDDYDYLPEPLSIPENIEFNMGESIATREAYGISLAKLAELNKNVLSLDAEVSNSTHAEEVRKSKPSQFIESFIAEQNMISMALGLSLKGFNVFASTFSAFLSRAHDQIRMAAISKASLTICGSHSGISIGEDGASQMGLEDLAMFRDLPGSYVFYPSDAVSAQKLVNLSAQIGGLKYIRTTRPKTPVIYLPEERFPVADFKILRQSSNDSLVLIGAGITLHESLHAHEFLKKNKIFSAVIDLYCIKPLNIKKLADFVKKHGNKIVVTEDHYGEGGIGEMLSHYLANSGIRIKSLSISEVPHSGSKEELLEAYGISARHIAMEARTFI